MAGDNARVFAAGETGAGRFDGACPASSIDDGDQYVLAVNHARFHPDDVLGELGNLFGRQGNARGEVETLRCGFPRFQQGAVTGVGVGIVVDMDTVAPSITSLPS